MPEVDPEGDGLVCDDCPAHAAAFPGFLVGTGLALLGHVGSRALRRRRQS